MIGLAAWDYLAAGADLPPEATTSLSIGVVLRRLP
jgi:hypothetical protein